MKAYGLIKTHLPAMKKSSFVIRENKGFGSESMKIWVVRLGEIK
jgi:hypothetical protein